MLRKLVTAFAAAAALAVAMPAVLACPDHDKEKTAGEKTEEAPKTADKAKEKQKDTKKTDDKKKDTGKTGDKVTKL